MKKPKPVIETTAAERIFVWEYNAEDVEIHPVCAALPAPRPENYERMKADIAARGQLHPGIVAMKTAQLVDGKTRWQICQELQIGFKVVVREFAGEADIEAFIWTENEARRQMTLDQIAMLKTHIYAERIEAAAKARQYAAGAQGGKRKNKTLMENSPEGSKAAPEGSGSTREILVKTHGVSEHRVKLALRVRKEGPDLVKPVIDGERTLRQAIKLIEEREKTGAEKPLEAGQVEGDMEQLEIPVLTDAQQAEVDEILAELDMRVANFEQSVRHAVWNQIVRHAQQRHSETGDPVRRGPRMRMLGDQEEQPEGEE